jgi:hypothetical protein
MINLLKNKRGLAFIPMLIIFAILLVIIFIIVKNPEICISPTLCFRFVPLRISKAIIFWTAFISFFLIQAGIIYLYYMGITKSITYVKKFINSLKKASLSIERYFIKMSY